MAVRATHCGINRAAGHLTVGTKQTVAACMATARKSLQRWGVGKSTAAPSAFAGPGSAYGTKQQLAVRRGHHAYRGTEVGGQWAQGKNKTPSSGMPTC